MQAIILAAGLGKRLGKLTENNTKCMLKIHGVTLIEQSLENLSLMGIQRLILVVGYEKEKLKLFLGNRYKNIQIIYVDNPIYDKTNNIYSLFLAKKYFIEDDTILLESDLIYDINILKNMIDDKRENLAAVDKYQSWMDGTVVKLNNDDSITNFIPKKYFDYKEIGKYYKTVNIYKFSKSFISNTYMPFLEAYSSALGNNEYYEQVLRVVTILENQDLKAYRLNGEKWYEIDDIQDKDNAETIFAKSPKEKLKLMQKRYGGYWRYPYLKDFCYLVNPYFPTVKMENEIKAYYSDLISMYPSSLNIQNLLASKMFKVAESEIVVGNGAAELIRAIGTVIEGIFGIVYPTFNEYPESINEERVVKFIPKNSDFSYNLNDLIELSKKCDNLLLINPDNPSGHFFSKPEIIELATKLQKGNKNLILDESFIDFSQNGYKESLIDSDILQKFKNLIIIKSISKSYGVPGIRLGVLATSNSKLMNDIRNHISIWNINSFGEFFLQIIGKYEEDYDIACKKIASERDRFFSLLNYIPYLRVVPSQSNYFLCEVISKFTATELAETLLSKYDIFIKDLSEKIGFENKEYVRIAVRDYDDNTFIIQQLRNL